LKQHPIWQAQQAAIAKLRKAAGGDAEPETGEQASPELTTAPTTEPVVEPANEPTPLPAAAETTPLASEPAADKEPEQAAPLRRTRSGAWAAAWMKANPRRKGEDASAYAQRMCDDMAKATDVTEAWPLDTCRRFLYRKPKTTDFAPEGGSVQELSKRHKR